MLIWRPRLPPRGDVLVVTAGTTDLGVGREAVAVLRA
jgi:NCAIR mutase (PurE)-related protein